MVSVDENTQVALEIVSEGTKLSGELILKILRELNNLFEKDKNAIKENNLFNEKNKQGKQSIKSLMKKHENGLDTLDDNINKEQVKEFSKEFNKLGVDFSTVKVGKDEYSFFFAGKDSSVVEKALKNVIEKKDKELQNEKDITKTNDRELTKKEPKKETVKNKLEEKKDKLKENIFSMKSVRELDRKFKAERKEKAVEKDKTKELSR